MTKRYTAREAGGKQGVRNTRPKPRSNPNH
jgi:hypothetical protein